MVKHEEINRILVPTDGSDFARKALLHAIKIAKKMSRNETIVITLSGRGDKDVEVVERYLKENVKNTR